MTTANNLTGQGGDQGINTLRRLYWSKLNKVGNLTEELNSKYRTTIKLKLRLADNTGNKPKQKSSWLLKDEDLVKPLDLQNSFDKIIQEKKEFMEALQAKKKSDSREFVGFLFSGISDKVKEIVILEKKIEKYNQSKSKACIKNKKQNAIEDFVKIHNELSSLFDCKSETLINLDSAIFKKDDVNIVLNEKFVEPIKEQLLDKYYQIRQELFQQKNQIKNNILLSINFKNWIPVTKLNNTFKRDLGASKF